MAPGLKTRVLHNDGSARMIRTLGDPNVDASTGTTDTPSELWLQWDNLDIRNEKAYVQTYLSVAPFDGFVVNGNESISNTWYVAEQPLFMQQDDMTGILVVRFAQTTLAGKSFPYEQRTFGPYTAGVTNKGTTTRTVYINHKTMPTLGSSEGSLRVWKNIYNRFDGVLDEVDSNAGSGGVGGLTSLSDEWVLGFATDQWGTRIERLIYTRWLAANAGTTASDHIQSMFRWRGQNQRPIEVPPDSASDNYGTYGGIEHYQSVLSYKKYLGNIWYAKSVTDIYSV